MTRVKVIDPGGRSITGYGWRAAGDYFELPDDLIDGLRENPYFEIEDSKPKQSRKVHWADETPQEVVE